MREVNYKITCDVCGKEGKLDRLDTVPTDWFTVDICGYERVPTPSHYNGIPKPKEILITIHINAECCSRKCVRELIKDELRREPSDK